MHSIILREFKPQSNHNFNCNVLHFQLLFTLNISKRMRIFNIEEKAVMCKTQNTEYFPCCLRLRYITCSVFYPLFCIH